MDQKTALNSVLHELFTLAAYDNIMELSSDEVATLNRSLGADWQQQLLTPITQPITLRSGKVVGKSSLMFGGGCPVVIKYFAKTLLVVYLTFSLLLAIQPIVVAHQHEINQVWIATQGYAKEVLSLYNSCPTGMNEPLWKNILCGSYAQVLKEVHYNTLDTVVKITNILGGASMGLSFANTTMAQVYSFVKFFVRRGDAAYSGALDAMCDIISSTFGIAANVGKVLVQPFTRTKKPTHKTQSKNHGSQVTAEQMAVMAKLLVAAAHQMKDEQDRNSSFVGGKGKRAKVV